mmetsp:Transcript_3983/g.7262  ORF Transcript_3983/g.7262 Transcript_3983/m.7262 type:complete len:251 (-) Transcript_3983:359-1111(-)
MLTDGINTIPVLEHLLNRRKSLPQLHKLVAEPAQVLGQSHIFRQCATGYLCHFGLHHRANVGVYQVRLEFHQRLDEADTQRSRHQISTNLLGSVGSWGTMYNLLEFLIDNDHILAVDNGRNMASHARIRAYPVFIHQVHQLMLFQKLRWVGPVINHLDVVQRNWIVDFETHEPRLVVAAVRVASRRRYRHLLLAITTQPFNLAKLPRHRWAKPNRIDDILLVYQYDLVIITHARSKLDFGSHRAILDIVH